LTGRRTTDRGDASGTGYWSPRESRYRYDLLRLVDAARDWSSTLPTVLSPTEPAGEWQGTETMVGAGTGDNMAVALGLGLRPGELALSFGTSATAFTVSEKPASDVTGTVAGFADGTGRFLPLVCTMNATKVIDAMARLLGVSLEQFDELALACSAGSGGLVLVPYFDGERTPNRPEATGSLRGLRSDATPAQIARATVEGVVCNLLAGVDTLRSAGLDGRVFLVGGAARSAAFRRVVADLIGSPVQTVPDELAATGAALQAAATFLDRDVRYVAESWGLGNGDLTEPDLSVDAEEIKARYADAARGEVE
jgi:xylulokinase